MALVPTALRAALSVGRSRRSPVTVGSATCAVVGQGTSTFPTLTAPSKYPLDEHSRAPSAPWCTWVRSSVVCCCPPLPPPQKLHPLADRPRATGHGNVFATCSAGDCWRTRGRLGLRRVGRLVEPRRDAVRMPCRLAAIQRRQPRRADCRNPLRTRGRACRRLFRRRRRRGLPGAMGLLSPLRRGPRTTRPEAVGPVPVPLPVPFPLPATHVVLLSSRAAAGARPTAPPRERASWPRPLAGPPMVRQH